MTELLRGFTTEGSESKLSRSLTVFLVLFSLTRSWFLASAPGFRESCRSRCAAAHPDDLINVKQTRVHLPERTLQMM